MRAAMIALGLVMLLHAQILSAAQYQIKDLGIAGRTATSARVNDSGQVIFSVYPEEPVGLPPLPGEVFLIDEGLLTSLGSLSGSYTIGTDINDQGAVVGLADVGGFEEHAFLYDGDVLVDLGVSGTLGSIATAINKDGDIVGRRSYGGTSQAFLRSSNGVVTDIGNLGGDRAAASDINDVGQIVGYSLLDQGFFPVALLYNEGQLINLGTLEGGVTSSASAINNLGQIVGSASSSDGIGHAAVFDPSAPPARLDNTLARSSAAAINNNGVIVGSLETEPGKPRAALFSLSVNPVLLQDLIPPDSGWDYLFSASDINDLGQIVGTGIFNSQPGLRAFIMTPIPEPSTTALLLSIAIVGILSRPRIRMAASNRQST